MCILKIKQSMKPISSIFFIISMFIVCVCPVFGQQGIGTGETPPDKSAVLELRSTTKALLLPRLTSAQMTAIPSPTAGMIVYNTDDNCLSYYDGSKFNNMAGVALSQLGSSYKAHYNGGASPSTTEVTYSSGSKFSSNSTCADQAISAGGCGGYYSVTGASGTVYSLKEINGQCWIAQNLQEVPSHFSGYTATSWINVAAVDMGYWGYYNTTTPTGASGWATVAPTNSNGSEGMLYQWSAAMNNDTAERGQGICPSGFHIPSDCEWMYLEHGLGMSLADQTSDIVLRGEAPEVGSKLTKDNSYSNLSGFTALFAGYRSSVAGAFSAQAGGGYFWTSSATNATTAVGRRINTASKGVYRSTAYSKATAYSVRCLKD